MTAGFIDELRSRAHWRTNFRPLAYGQALESLDACRDLVFSNSVEKRGWDYPHIPQREGDDTGVELGENYVQAWIDWSGTKEFWRMYESGQFLHYSTVESEWAEEDTIWGGLRKPISGSLGIFEINWRLCEIFEFLSRIANSGIYDRGAEVNISLRGTKGRTLYVDDSRRHRFVREFRTEANSLDYSGHLSREAISAPKQLALKASKKFYDRFGWNPSDDQIMSFEDELYSLKMRGS